MNAVKLIPLLGIALRASKDHSHVWNSSSRDGRDYGVRTFYEDYRKAVSKLFKEVTGAYPSQEQLEAIDPDFRMKGD